jgi:hypothetical protein
MRAAFSLLVIVAVLVSQVAPAHEPMATGRRPATARLLAHLPASCGLCEGDADRVAAPRPGPARVAAADEAAPGAPHLIARGSTPHVFHPRRLPPRSRGSDADAAH